MGYMVELNTLLGLPKDFDVNLLKAGEKYKIVKDRERAFPLHIAVLIVDSEWNFYGYCRVNSALVHESKTEFEFEVISLFTDDEKQTYKQRFVDAAKFTGEIK
jgi:hypothetical protein